MTHRIAEETTEAEYEAALRALREREARQKAIEALTGWIWKPCPKCGGPMVHYRLKGYRCPRCD
jgi:rubrerythrin